MGSCLNFRGLAYYYHGGECGGMQEGMVLQTWLMALYPGLQVEGETLGLAWASEIPKPILSHILSTTKPHLMIISEKFH